VDCTIPHLEEMVLFITVTVRKVTRSSVCKLPYNTLRSPDSSVGIAMNYGPDGWGSIPGRGKKFLSIPKCPNGLWGPSFFLSNGHKEIFLRG
jgi:hypothetical protein